MSTAHIRPLAICVFRHEGRILVTEAHDPVKRQSFCRPLGGGIEFGETSAQAVTREVREEINAEVTQLKLIGTLENIFTYLGVPGHEIVQVYDGEFVDRSLYGLESIAGTESDGQAFQAVWLELEQFSVDLPLFPEGLLDLLRAREARLAAEA